MLIGCQLAIPIDRLMHVDATAILSWGSCGISSAWSYGKQAPTAPDLRCPIHLRSRFQASSIISAMSEGCGKAPSRITGITCASLNGISPIWDVIRSRLLPVVTAFITTQASHFGRTAMISLASILRVFLRYLHRERILQRDISKLVEIPQRYRLADIPRWISWGSVQDMLDQVDRRTVVARRDYAMLLLMAVYGLRSREVALVTLDDIDWKRDRLHVRGRKAEHSTTYPLAPVVGEAIVGYLRNGRPDVQSRLLFWRHLPPQSPLTHSAVSATASKYLHRAGMLAVRDHTLSGMPASSAWWTRDFRSRPSATMSAIGLLPQP